MFFNELGSEARRRLIDVQQRGAALRSAQSELRRRFTGSMAWKTRSNRDYLYRRNGSIDKSLGPRSDETEAIYTAFTDGKAAVEQRVKGLRHALEDMARVNRAMGIGRVPNLVGRILRQLDAAGVLGEQVCVVGTNALFAYEAHAGIRFESGLLATDDLDLALDARRNLSLAARTMPDGLLGLLRKIDPSFAPLGRNHFTAVSDSGVMVDLITPEPRDRMAGLPRQKRRLGSGPDVSQGEDLEAVEVPRLEMIVDAPRFSTVAVTEDGLPVWIAAADPRWWAAHKLWLGSERERQPIKRQRDKDQGNAVAAMLATVWDSVDLSDGTLASIPMDIRRALREAVAMGARADEKANW